MSHLSNGSSPPSAPWSAPDGSAPDRATADGASPDRLRPGEVTPEGARATAIPDNWSQLLALMVLSRAIESRLNNLFLQGRLHGRLISGRGQEAIPVGATATTRPDDLVCPAHRDLGAHLARGTTPEEVFLQYLWRADSPSRGRDGDVHFGVWSRGVLPMISHLPDSWPVALGLALAKQRQGAGGVVLAFCGDGATSTGSWHETVNLAAVWQLPLVLIVENNQYAYSTPVSQQFRVASLADRAPGYGIPGARVDGNDVVAVQALVSEAIAAARRGGGPTMIEAVTMRMDGHAIHDQARYVPTELLDAWRQRDPIEGFAARLQAAGLLDGAALAALRDDAAERAERAYQTALEAPEPDPAALTEGVYANPAAPARTRPAVG